MPAMPFTSELVGQPHSRLLRRIDPIHHPARVNKGGRGIRRIDILAADRYIIGNSQLDSAPHSASLDNTYRRRSAEILSKAGNGSTARQIEQRLVDDYTDSTLQMGIPIHGCLDGEVIEELVRRAGG